MIVAHTLNRLDRLDRWLLYKGAMAASGFEPSALTRHIAVNKEDYRDQGELCEAGAVEFPEYFNFHKDSKTEYPGFGHLVCTWGTLRAWSTIAEGDSVAIFTCDDYYLKARKRKLEKLVSTLENVNIIQLAHHARDDIFFYDTYGLNLSYKFGQYKISELSQEVYEGMGHSSSESHLLSPYGASCLLEYLTAYPKLNAEPASQGMYQAFLNGDFKYVEGVYSVVHNDISENGLVVMQNNRWIGHLIEYSEGAKSDLREWS